MLRVFSNILEGFLWYIRHNYTEQYLLTNTFMSI